MNKRKLQNWVKEICLLILFAVEVVFTFLSFHNGWAEEFRLALVFAEVLTVFNGLLSIIDKWDYKNEEMRRELKKEHEEIKGALELYKDIEELEYVAYFEGNYTKTHKNEDTEIWIISNCVREPDEVLSKIYKNIIKGVKYYYIIPKGEGAGSSESDLKNSFITLCTKYKKSKDHLQIAYLIDELFDLIPTDVISILFYCQPNSDYNNNMRIFYAFQENKEDGKIFYKPVRLTQAKAKSFFTKMEEWKKKEWNLLESK